MNESHDFSSSHPYFLIVDDEEMIVEEMVEALTLEGYNCVGVTDGTTAFGHLSQGRNVGCVITDLKMPGVTGAALIAKAVKSLLKLPVFIVISGHVDPDELEHECAGLEEHIAAVFRKPLDIWELISFLKASENPALMELTSRAEL